jgi:hypothetical protein
MPSYNQAQYMPERKVMMQEWANRLGKLKAGAQIFSVFGRRTNECYEFTGLSNFPLPPR